MEQTHPPEVRSYMTSQYNKTYVRIDDKNQPELYSPLSNKGKLP